MYTNNPKRKKYNNIFDIISIKVYKPLYPFTNSISTPFVIPTQAEFTTWYNAVVANGGSLTGAQQGYVNDTIYYLKQRGVWTNLDCLQVDFGGASVGLVDLKTPSRIATNNSCTISATFGITGTGGSNYVNTNYNPGDGGTYNYKQNDSSYGYLLLTNSPLASNRSHVCSAGAGFANFNAFENEANVSTISYLGGNDTYNNTATGTPPISNVKPLPLINSWYQIKRNNSSNFTKYYNSAPISVHTKASVAVQNCKFARFINYANNAIQAGSGTTERQGCFYAGNSSVDAGVLQAILTRYLIHPFTSSYTDAYSKLIIFDGDSFNGGLSTAPSVSSTYPKSVASNLGAGWCFSVASTNGHTTSQVISDFSTYVAPITCTDYEKKIYVLQCGTNDLYNGTTTAAQILANYQSLAASARALGFKVVIGGIVARDASGGSGGQASFDTRRATLRTLMQTEFPTSAGTNIYTGASWADGWVDAYGDTTLQTFSNLTYFQADATHLTATGYTNLATMYSNLIAQL